MNLSDYLSRVRQQAPVIHAISNYVTANDVANVVLACGASPIMADDPEESAYITALSAGLVLNLGTLSRRRVPAMVASGETAARLGRPVLLDPVGAGASPMRTDTARMLLQRLPVTALRCNASELRAILSGAHTHRGVDADGQDRQGESGLSHQIAFVKKAARQLGCLVAVTGETDLVSAGESCVGSHNGQRRGRPHWPPGDAPGAGAGPAAVRPARRLSGRRPGPVCQRPGRRRVRHGPGGGDRLGAHGPL